MKSSVVMPGSSLSITPTAKEFAALSSHLKRLTGINLPYNDKNIALFSSRIQKLKVEGAPVSIQEIIDGLESGHREISYLFITSMTTNTTHFFRERQHFDYIKKSAKDIVGAKSRTPLRVWCAASSTGEEPYSIAITFAELMKQYNFDFKLLATDVDPVVLNIAKQGIYGPKQVEQLPSEILQNYFLPKDTAQGTQYQVRPALREKVKFGQFNLMLNYPFKDSFDLIFCRNVLIYFEKDTVTNVVGKLVDVLSAGGLLFLGHSEAIAGSTPRLTRVGPAIYQKKPR